MFVRINDPPDSGLNIKIGYAYESLSSKKLKSFYNFSRFNNSPATHYFHVSYRVRLTLFVGLLALGGLPKLSKPSYWSEVNIVGLLLPYTVGPIKERELVNER